MTVVIFNKERNDSLCVSNTNFKFIYINNLKVININKIDFLGFLSVNVCLCIFLLYENIRTCE